MRRVDATTGIVTTIVGPGLRGGPSGDGGPPSKGQLGSSTTGGTMRVFPGAQNLWIADSANFAVRKVTLYRTLV